MTNTEYRQFLTELEFIGKSKDFSGITNKVIKGIVGMSANQVLLDKRKKYDYMIANLFEKYAIVNDDLYDELDGFWGKCESGDTKVEKALHTFDAIGGGISLGNIACLQLCFKNYMSLTYDYCSKYVKELKDGQ